MKKLYFLLFGLLIGASSYAQTTVFINELHYDNSGGDLDEGVEIAGPAGTDLSTYTITAYNGNNGESYDSLTLSGTIPDEASSGFGTVWFAISGLQNGAPDGIVLDNNGSLIQFLSYEGSFDGVGGVADGVTSEDIGVTETSSTPAGESLQLSGTGDTYEEFSWNAPAAHSRDLINPGQTFSMANTPSIIITTPSNNTEFISGTTSVDVEWTTNNLGGGETVSVTVNGNTSNNETSPFNIVTMDGESYDVTVELIDGGVLDSDMISFSIGAITQVATIADLRAGNINDNYELTGEALITYLTGFRNQKNIEDATGAILIDDNSGVIISSYALADGITGLKGRLGEFNNTLQFVPLEDPGAPSSTGNTLTPQTVTFADLLSASESYESELVTVTNVTFDNTETNFSNGLEIEMTQSSDVYNFRTVFNEDYSTGIIPTTPTDVTGIILDRSGDYFLMARYASDFTFDVLSAEGFDVSKFSIYPNPTNSGRVTISSATSEAITVRGFDILGKEVLSAQVSNNTLDVSDLKAGVYILKITQNNASVTKKLVIK